MAHEFRNRGQLVTSLFSSVYYPLLIRGDYQSVAHTAVDQGTAAPSPIDLPWVIAALTFLGRRQEAEGLFEARKGDLDVHARIASRFFLAVSFCREGEFAASKKTLLENAREARHSTDSIDRFFYFQGFAFFRYSTGRLSKAQNWVEAALKEASGASFNYGSALALELLGHIQLSSGRFHAGFRNFNLAKDKATQLGQGALYQAIDVSSILYRASFGIAKDSETLLNLLESYISNEFFQDSYTQAALNLELARIYTLRGELREAKQQLETSSEMVYKINNPDLEMDYNLQLAQLLRSQGEYHQALSIVRSAKHRVQGGEDIRSQLRVLGFESQLLKGLGRSQEYDALLPTLKKLSHQSGTLMAKRHLLRSASETALDVRPGEDMLGDLIDRIAHFTDSVVPDILRGGWFGLLATPLNVLPHESVLYFDAEPGSLTIFFKGETRHVGEGCSTLVRNLLVLLSQRPCSKENLANTLWHQPYNPTRHDGLIYSLIAKARKCLGPMGDWIEVNESGYLLRSTVRVSSIHFLMEDDVDLEDFTTSPRSEGSATQLGDNALNSRQIQIMDALKRGENVGPGELVKRLGVSDATISRDLAALVEKGVAIRTGRGRSTRYSLNLL
jgi:tetratricopeptide (TPR) repeat protein